MSYAIPDEPQAGLKRYAVAVRFNVDLKGCPSTDEVTTHVVWADQPYDAMCAVEIINRQQRGLHLRRVIGVEECPAPLARLISAPAQADE